MGESFENVKLLFFNHTQHGGNFGTHDAENEKPHLKWTLVLIKNSFGFQDWHSSILWINNMHFLLDNSKGYWDTLCRFFVNKLPHFSIHGEKLWGSLL